MVIQRHRHITDMASHRSGFILGLESYFNKSLNKQLGRGGHHGSWSVAVGSVASLLENLANPADRDQYELLCRENTGGLWLMQRMPWPGLLPLYRRGQKCGWQGRLDLGASQSGSGIPLLFLCIRVPAWIWGAFPHSLLPPATVEILVLGTVGAHHMSSTSLTTGLDMLMGSSDHKAPPLASPTPWAKNSCKRPLLPHSILLGCIGILKLQRCPSSRSCSPLIPLAWTPQQQVLTVSVLCPLLEALLPVYPPLSLSISGSALCSALGLQR